MTYTNRTTYCDCGSHFYLRTEMVNADGTDLVPAWECTNCGKYTPRKVRTRGAQITPSQQRIIERYRGQMLATAGGGGQEFKRFETTMLEHGIVSLCAEVGLVNDEGTAASIFARDRWQIFIGRSGGCSSFLLRDGRTKTIRGFHSCLYHHDS